MKFVIIWVREGEARDEGEKKERFSVVRRVLFVPCTFPLVVKTAPSIE
jgi:hypothetical protein